MAVTLADYLVAFTSTAIGRFKVHLLTSLPVFPYDVANFQEPTYDGYKPALLDGIGTAYDRDSGFFSLAGVAYFVFTGSMPAGTIVAVAVTLNTIPEQILAFAPVSAGAGDALATGQNIYSILLVSSIPTEL